MSWQEFERFSRDFVRSLGYYVHPGPYLLLQKNVDIYGEHLFFSNYNGTVHQPSLFVGECKDWGSPIGSSVVYELSGLIQALPNTISVEAAIFSRNGFSSRALDALIGTNISVFEKKTIESYLLTRFQNRTPGEVNRPSFPGYTNLNQLMDLLTEISLISDLEISSVILKPVLEKKGWTEGNLTWTTSLLNIGVILGLLEFVRKDGSTNLYSPTTDLKSVVQIWLSDPQAVVTILQPIATKNRWMREIIFFAKLSPGLSITEIARQLEYSQPGFDVESIKMAVKLGRDLDIFDFNDGLLLRDEIIDLLW